MCPPLLSLFREVRVGKIHPLQPNKGDLHFSLSFEQQTTVFLCILNPCGAFKRGHYLPESFFLIPYMNEDIIEFLILVYTFERFPFSRKKTPFILTSRNRRVWSDGVNSGSESNPYPSTLQSWIFVYVVQAFISTCDERKHDWEFIAGNSFITIKIYREKNNTCGYWDG